MMNARIELRGEELFCGDTGEVGGSSVRPLPQEALSREAGPALRCSGALAYVAAAGRDRAGHRGLSRRRRPLARPRSRRDRRNRLEVAVPGRPEERERILLDVPWELLRIASATIATGFGDPEQEYFAGGTATKNSSP
jgi:hypothetical protein